MGFTAKKVARLYNSLGWWEFYKTDDGHQFTVRDGKEFWYDGNLITGDKAGACFIDKKYHEELFEKIAFVR
jgi:hypothetical protein